MQGLIPSTLEAVRTAANSLNAYLNVPAWRHDVARGAYIAIGALISVGFTATYTSLTRRGVAGAERKALRALLEAELRSLDNELIQNTERHVRGAKSMVRIIEVHEVFAQEDKPPPTEKLSIKLEEGDDFDVSVDFYSPDDIDTLLEAALVGARALPITDGWTRSLSPESANRRAEILKPLSQVDTAARYLQYADGLVDLYTREATEAVLPLTRHSPNLQVFCNLDRADRGRFDRKLRLKLTAQVQQLRGLREYRRAVVNALEQIA